MTQYLLLYCPYNPDNYRGHRIEPITADTLQEAKAKAKNLLDKRWVGTLWEFRLIELGTHDSGSRLWDTRSEPNENENTYTTAHYWEATQ